MKPVAPPPVAGRRPDLPHPRPVAAWAAGGRRVWSPLLGLTLLLWIALVCTGFGHASGLLPAVAADRVDAQALVQLRHAGASQAWRLGRSEATAVVRAELRRSDPPAAVLDPPVAALVLVAALTLPPAGAPAHAAAGSVAVPPAGLRWRVPPGRAPPVTA